MLNINYLTFYPVRLSCKLRTCFHFVSNLRFHIYNLYNLGAKIRLFLLSSKLFSIFLHPRASRQITIQDL